MASVAEIDSSGIECLRSKVEVVGKREREGSERREEEALEALLRCEGRKSLVKALAMLFWIKSKDKQRACQCGMK